MPSPDKLPAAPVRSMTGFAMVRKDTSVGMLTVSLRTVNHRGLDLHFHIGELGPFENSMRSLLKRNIARGHVEIRASLARNADTKFGYNRDLLTRYLGLFRAVREEFDLKSEPDLNFVLALPGIFENAPEATPLEHEFEAELMHALARCIHDLNAHREREGSALLSEFYAELASIEERTREIAAIRSQALEAFHRRLRERLQELLRDASIPENRLAEEAALLADRSDVHEELTRLEVHTGELGRILSNGGEIGKRLDFLLQEMNRETNTVLSKTSGAGETGLTVTNLALGIKANIERIREQALNLE